MDLAIWVQIVSTQWLQSRGIQPGFLGGILTQTAWNHNMGLPTFQVQTTPCFQGPNMGKETRWNSATLMEVKCEASTSKRTLYNKLSINFSPIFTLLADDAFLPLCNTWVKWGKLIPNGELQTCFKQKKQSDAKSPSTRKSFTKITWAHCWRSIRVYPHESQIVVSLGNVVIGLPKSNQQHYRLSILLKCYFLLKITWHQCDSPHIESAWGHLSIVVSQTNTR